MKTVAGMTQFVQILTAACCLLALPTADAGAAAAVAKVIFGGVKVVAKSDLVKKTVAYGTAGALAGAGDMAGDYISSKVEANNRLEVAKMQQQAFNDLQLAIPAKSSVTIIDVTEVTDGTSSKASQADLHNLLVALLNTTFSSNRAAVVAPSPTVLPQTLSPALSPQGDQIAFLYYVIGVICIMMVLICCAGCICCLKLFCADKLENDFKVKFLNGV